MVCLYEDAFGGVFPWGMTLGVRNAMLMRGGACAAHLPEMGVGVRCVVYRVCRVLSNVLGECDFFFFFFLPFFLTFFFRLCGFGAGLVGSCR